MARIEISAVVTDGAAVLFEVGGPADDVGARHASPLPHASPPPHASPLLPRLALPRYVLGANDDSIEDALAAGLRAEYGLEVIEQQFVDTVYERTPGDGEMRLNNLQLVTRWDGALPERTAAGRELAQVPIEALATLDLPYELRQALLGAFGIDAGPRLQPAAVRGRVIVITGPAGAGKSTVGGLVARSMSRCALVHVDDVRHMVVSGAPRAHWDGGEYEPSFRHGLLSFRNAAALATNFSEAGYDAVVEGIFEQPEELDLLLAELGGAEAYFVTLLPDAAELERRDQSRPPEQRMGARSREHHDIFSFNGELRGLRIDTTALTAAETAALILETLAEARVR